MWVATTLANRLHQFYLRYSVHIAIGYPTWIHAWTMLPIIIMYNQMTDIRYNIIPICPLSYQCNGSFSHKGSSLLTVMKLVSPKINSTKLYIREVLRFCFKLKVDFLRAVQPAGSPKVKTTITDVRIH